MSLPRTSFESDGGPPVASDVPQGSLVSYLGAPSTSHSGRLGCDVRGRHSRGYFGIGQRPCRGLLRRGMDGVCPDRLLR